MSFVVSPAALSAVLQGSIVLLTKSSIRDSNFARVSVFTKCFGIPSTAVIYGRLISVLTDDESSTFAFSDASLSLCKAIGSFDKSWPSSFLNSSTSQSVIRSSKSEPPKCVSPSEARTSNTPLPKSRIETSCVPEPQSHTTTFISLSDLSMPYAIAAAVGSLMIRRHFIPAISAAFFVALRCTSLK